MNSILVQVNFSFNMTPEEYVQTVSPFADAVAAVDGLRWKIWLIDEDNCEAAGHYLFESAEAARAYLEGPILAPFAASPAVRNISIKMFDIMDEPTAVTRGPVNAFV